jgi:hypothetical protein
MHRNAYTRRSSVRKLVGKKPFQKHRHMWETDIKMDINENGKILLKWILK